MANRGSVRRIRAIAWREFRYTALTKGFLIGAIILPLIMFAAIPLLPMLLSSKSAPLIGRVVVIDPTNSLAKPFQMSLPMDSDESQEKQDNSPLSEPLHVELSVETISDPARVDEFRAQLKDSSLRGLIIVTPGADGLSAELLVPSGASPRHTTVLESTLRESLTRARGASQRKL